MKSKGIFWGVFFLTLGVLFLLESTTSFAIVYPFWKFWPILLILWGVSLIVKLELLKKITALINAVLFVLIIFSLYNQGQVLLKDTSTGYSRGDFRNKTAAFFEKSSDSIQTATFTLKSGLCIANISDVDTLNLVSVFAKNGEHYSLDRQDTGKNSELELSLSDNKINFPKDNILNIMLKREVQWNLDIQVGVSNINLDLTKFNIRDITINSGVTKVNLKMGSISDSSNIDIETGLSTINLELPSEVGCRLIGDIELSSKNIVGLNKIRKNYYETESFENAKKKIYINMKVGLSSINIKRALK